MFLTILGLAIPTAVSIEGAVHGQKQLGAKLFLLLCAIGGFGLAIYSSVDQSRKAAIAQDQARSNAQQLVAANDRLQAQAQMLKLIDGTVGDLGTLNRISGGKKYYVRIAADTSKKRLEPFLNNIERQFGGAKASGLVSIRSPRQGSNNFELTFGNGLDVAAAEVFQRLATNHGFHRGEVIPILPEP